MILISKNIGELVDALVALTTNCNHKDYPTEFQTYDEAWEELQLSFDHLRSKLGEDIYLQVADMAAQAKAHYESESSDKQQLFLASWLMQDIEQVVKGKPPYAYPEELYRWPKK